MKIFDSHCHLDDRSYAKDLEQVIHNAHQAEVAAMMVVGVDAESSKKAVAIAQGHDKIYASVGLHPHDAQTCSEAVLLQLRGLAANESVKAWGETGLDFNRMYSPQKDQEHWFARQLEIGAELGLPMIFHERDSQGRFLSMLRSCWGAQRQGVVHCFSGTPDELAAYLELDLYIGITGILTIQSRGWDLRRMVHDIPDNRLVIETDAPYLTPTPERNRVKRNEPAFVRTVLFKLAEVLGRPPESLAAILWQNTCRLFGLTP
jgi:TatD DNase family protein